MMESNEQTIDLLSQPIKEEFECDIVYEPIKREIVEEESIENEIDHDQSDSEDDVFFENVEPGPSKKLEKDIVKNVPKLVEKEPCLIEEVNECEGSIGISESDTETILDKSNNSGYLNENMLSIVEKSPGITKPNLISETSSMKSGLKTGLQNTRCEVDNVQNKTVLIINLINEKFSMRNKDSPTHNKNSGTDSEMEIENDIEIVYEDISWEDHIEDKRVISCEVCKKSFGNEEDLSNHQSVTTGCRGQNKLNINSTEVIQGEKSSEDLRTCPSTKTSKDSGLSGVLPTSPWDMDIATITKQNLSSIVGSHSSLITFKDDVKILKVILHRNFGLRYLPPELKCLKSSYNKERPFQCEYCSKSFDRSSMLRHRRYHHHEKPQCATCSKTFHSKYSLLCHIKGHTGELPFRCKSCSKSFSRYHSLLRHEKIHKKIIQYHCKVCQKSFFNKTVYMRHKNSHELKLFNCKLCTASFRNSCTLESHLRNHNTYKFHCTFCPKSFDSRARLTTHENIHRGEKPFKCKYCPKAFADRSHIASHERTHSGERPYLCKVCQKTFTQSSHLRTHEKIHIGKKPFECKICSKSFIYPFSLSLHKRVHKSKKERWRDDKYHCKLCSKSFAGRTDLERHENVHGEVKPYQCEFCSKAYAAKSTLQTHTKYSHKKSLKSKA